LASAVLKVEVWALDSNVSENDKVIERKRIITRSFELSRFLGAFQ
jgi:hypothetical protein